ncbi:hypothetical protein CDCA_CDCA11G3185 [Cyanidium caldarium]|uniref:DNA polymerase delta subunit 3 n=1 Tax=Cyanidium caldarium TaxID=2771 RepID=A0AAV9IYI6_CYACA|nr:hypothetical protein CDCA_CDCA11G3185 [Cyanidium caldarium]
MDTDEACLSRLEGLLYGEETAAGGITLRHAKALLQVDWETARRVWKRRAGSASADRVLRVRLRTDAEDGAVRLKWIKVAADADGADTVVYGIVRDDSALPQGDGSVLVGAAATVVTEPALTLAEVDAVAVQGAAQERALRRKAFMMGADGGEIVGGARSSIAEAGSGGDAGRSTADRDGAASKTQTVPAGKRTAGKRVSLSPAGVAEEQPPAIPPTSWTEGGRTTGAEAETAVKAAATDVRRRTRRIIQEELNEDGEMVCRAVEVPVDEGNRSGDAMANRPFANTLASTDRHAGNTADGAMAMDVELNQFIRSVASDEQRHDRQITRPDAAETADGALPKKPKMDKQRGIRSFFGARA